MSTSAPSASPRKPPRWRVPLIALGGLVTGLAAVVATYPMWADTFVRDEVVRRIERLTGQHVVIEDFALEYSHVTMRGVSMTIAADTRVRLDRVDVILDRDALWSGRAVVTEVVAQGGSLTGDVAAFEALAEDVRDRLGPREGRGEGRVKIVPRQAQARGLRLELRRHIGERVATLAALADVEVSLPDDRATVELHDVEVGLDSRSVRAAKISAVLHRTPGTPGLQFPLTVNIEGGAAALTPQIAVADIRGSVELADAALRNVAVTLAGGFSDEPRSAADDGAAPLWSLKGSGARDFSAGSVELKMDAFKLGKIPSVLAQLPVVDSEEATVGGDLKLSLAGGLAQVEGDLTLAGLNIDHHLLARQPVRGVGFAFNFTGEIDPLQRRVTVEAATLRRGGLEIDFDGELIHAEDRGARKYRLHLAVPKVACQEVIKAIPAELAPSLVGFELKGDFELELAADIDFADLEKLTLTGRVERDKCKAVKVPALVSSDRLGGAFVHRVTMRDGAERTVDLHEGSQTYTALDQISPYMTAAVLTTEDGGFWRHRGFITSQFPAALRSNLEAGKIRLGASTITMQMVKNVLLSHERTLSRKLQELFLTWYVEQSLSKQRIMEVYLNVIEFGPGVYGITRAASHYFGKTPGELTPPDAAFLALMLPSPVRRHVHYCEGQLSPAFQAKMKRLLAIMQSRGRLDPETYELWKEGVVTFEPSELGSKRACLAEIQRLLAASEQQRSISGLLDDSGFDDEALPIALDEAALGQADDPNEPPQLNRRRPDAAAPVEGDGQDAFLQAEER